MAEREDIINYKHKHNKAEQGAKSNIVDEYVELKQNDLTLKLIFAGDSGVGKSAILKRFNINRFSEDSASPSGLDYVYRNFIVDGERVRLMIWDPAGQEQFRALAASADGVILVYDVTNAQSFTNLTRWLREVEQFSAEAHKVIVGNKIDLVDPSRKVVLTADAASFAEQRAIPLFESSAKDNVNVEEVFLALTRKVVETKRQREREEEQGRAIEDRDARNVCLQRHSFMNNNETAPDNIINIRHENDFVEQLNIVAHVLARWLMVIKMIYILVAIVIYFR